jgi:hypothetical protein
MYYVAHYTDMNSDRNVNYPIGVYTDETLALKDLYERWTQLKNDSSELIAELEESGEDVNDEPGRAWYALSGPYSMISVNLTKLENKDRLIGFFIAKGWNGKSSWPVDSLKINKKLS